MKAWTDEVAGDTAEVVAPAAQAMPTGRTFPTDDSVPEEWQIGDVILSLYEVKEIKAGGRGTVYRVRHKQWNMDLAVKSPHPQFFTDERHKQNFVREAEDWINIGLHPHIVGCFYVRRLGKDRVPRVFAEYVEGGSLEEWIRSGKLYEGGKEQALECILDIAIQTAWGLDYAHEFEYEQEGERKKGLVHRDFKPANVMMTLNGTARVTDFGGGVTPAYCSPEQKAAIALTRQTDIWSWAVSVLEMFTGGVTWISGHIADYALAHYLENQPENPNLPRMPTALADLLKQCLARDPSHRPATMSVVADILLEVYAQSVGQSYPREKPNPLDLRADSLNNRAVSYLDLGREDKAVQCWQEALQTDPAHLEANFNYGYYRWHRAELLGSEYLKQMQQLESTHGQDPEYWRLLGWIYLEQGYVDEVEEILQKRGVQDEMLEQAHRNLQRPIVREIQSFREHTDYIDVVAISEGGLYALSASADYSIRMWKVETGETLWKITNERFVDSLAFSPDKIHVLAGCKDGSVRLLELMTGQEMKRFTGHTDRVWSVIFSLDGLKALSGGADGTVRVWSVETGMELQCFRGHGSGVVSCSFSLDERYILTGHANGIIELWDTKTRVLADTICLQNYLKTVTFVAEKQIGVICDNGEITVCRLETGEKSFHKISAIRMHITSASFSRDGKYAVLGDILGNIWLWSLEGGYNIRVFSAHLHDVNCVSFSPDSTHIISGGEDENINVYELRYTTKFPLPYPLLARGPHGSEAHQLQTKVQSVIQQAKIAIHSGKYKEVYHKLRQAQQLTGYAHERDVLDLVIKIGRQAGRIVGLRDSWKVCSYANMKVMAAAISSDECLALILDDGKSLNLWELFRGSKISNMIGHVATVNVLSISPTIHYAVSASYDDTVRLWHLYSGREIWKSRIGSLVNCVLFSPDERWCLIGCSDGSVRFLQLHSGRTLKVLETNSETCALAISPDGRYILSGHSELLRLWESSTGRELWCINMRDKINSLYFSANGCFWAASTSHWLGELYLGTTHSPTVKELRGHTSSVNSVMFSPDGQFLLSGSNDGTLRVWDIRNLCSIWSCNEGGVWIDYVVFSLDGRYILYSLSHMNLRGFTDKAIRLWEFDWEWEFPDPADWDEGARPYLDIFLTLHTPYGPDGLSRVGAPQWTEEDFQKLLRDLGLRGYGWLRPEGVRRELERMARERK